MIREVHGVSGAKKVAAGVGDLQSVTVTDRPDHVRLDLGACSYPADLTLEQARFIAKQLNASAARVAKNKAQP